jgi:hypothetical protein
MIEIILYSFTILLVSLILGVSIFRRPVSSTKVTFSLFGILLVIWNLLELVFRLGPALDWNISFWQTVLSTLTLYAMVLYSMHFPYFSRRENKINYFSVFLGGIGYAILMHTFAIPLIESSFPLDAKFFIKVNHFIAKSFTVLCLFSFVWITFLKLNRSLHRLKVAFFRALVVFFLFGVAFLALFYFFGETSRFLPNGIELALLDSLFILACILAFSQFKFVNFYPGILSVFMHGEIPRLVVQKTAPATGKGASYLKNELWKMYEVENWGNFLSEFWFSIIIDESIDNALEHGGKRIDDEIVVQIFETDKFLDFYVIDMGKGFDPNSIPDPSRPDRKSIPTGRGLYILKKLFQVDWNFLGNEVRIRVSKNPQDNPQES